MDRYFSQDTGRKMYGQKDKVLVLAWNASRRHAPTQARTPRAAGGCSWWKASAHGGPGTPPRTERWYLRSATDDPPFRAAAWRQAGQPSHEITSSSTGRDRAVPLGRQ